MNKRENRMRLIDANGLMAQLTKKKPGAANDRYTDGYNDAIMCFRSMVHRAPAVDAVPVVRSKDWFCADGERKGGDE